MIKAWRCRELNRIIIGDSISVSCDDCFSDKICTIKLVPCDAEEVVVIPKAEHLKVQAVLAAAERVDKSFDGKVNPTALEKVEQANALISLRVALTKIREVTK